MTIEAQVRGHLARGNQREAAAEALRALGPQVLGYLESLVGDPDDARDVFQAFAEELWHWLPTWRGEGALRAWSYRLAWHAAARFQRGAWQRRRQRLRTTMASRIAASVASSVALVTTQPVWVALGARLFPESAWAAVPRPGSGSRCWDPPRSPATTSRPAPGP